MAILSVSVSHSRMTPIISIGAMAAKLFSSPATILYFGTGLLRQSIVLRWVLSVRVELYTNEGSNSARILVLGFPFLRSLRFGKQGIFVFPLS